TSGSGVATTPSSNTSGVTGLTVGAATVFKWTVTNGACTANASVTVTSSAGITANAGTAQNVCNSTTATLAATNPSPGTGAWTTTSGTGVATTPSSNTSGVTGLTVGASTTFKWTVTNGTCSANASVTIISDAPVTSNAGSNFGICNATTATLAGTNPATGTGTWTVTSGSGSVTDIHAANSGVTGLTVGTTSTFQWVVTNGSCTSGASTVTITVSSSPQSNAGTSQEVCNTTTGTLTANTTISAGTWTGPAGATFGDSHSPNTSVSGLIVGDNIFTWSVTNGYCTTAATSTTTITVDAPSQSSAGADQSFCNVTTASLNAGTSVGTGTWSGPAGVSITDPSSPTSGVSGLAVGANVFTWSVKSGVCTAATSTMTITVSAPGTTSAGPDQGLCNVTTTSLAGSGSGTWTPISGTGVLTTPSSATSGVTGLTVGGTSVFQWTVTSGACSGSAQVSVTVSAPPTGAAGTDQGLCNATTTTLSATGTGSWTTASGTGVATDPTNTSSPVTGLTVGATSVFTWTVVNGFCTSATNLSVVSSSPATSNAGSSSTLCNATTANLAATGTGTWTTTAGTGIVTTPSDPNSGVTALTPGQSSDFTWTVTSGNCSATSTVTIVSSAPVTADAGPAQSLCNVTTATLAGVGTGTWTAAAISGTGAVTNPSNGNSGVTGLTIGASSTFTWTVTNGACSNAANVTISVSQGTTPDAGSDATLCNVTSTTLGATGTGTWTITSGAGTIVDISDPHTGVTVTTSPATFTWTINGGGCGSLSDSVILTAVVLAKPTVSGSGTSGVCSGSTYTFNVTNIDGGATYNWLQSSPGSNVNLHTPTNTTSVDVDATSSDYIVVKVDKGGCEDTAHVAVIVLPGLPSSGGTFHLATCADSLLLKTIVFDTNFYTGSWSSTDGGITFNPVTDSTFILKNFTNGKDTLHFTVSGTCGTATYTFYLQVGGEFLSAVMSGPSDTLCVGNNRELTMEVTPADTNNAYTYVWVTHVNFDHPVIDNTVHLDTTSVGVYNVSPDSDKNIYLGYVYDKYSGCQAAIDTARVYASTGQDLNVPNLITPNGDHQNDHWLLRDKVTHQDILPGSKFDLYNRWGQRVFTMDSYDNRFNASGISDGIYFFNLKAGCGGKEYKGWLEILGNTNP
ncbi:MAG: hypothetical protein JWO58_2094, partial [Chitinophagaceae bacterium]|nr:hypothetical protein [Chitinophagaceae bacterium]